MLALLALVVITRRVPCLYTLRVLGRIREREQLLLKLGGNVNTSKMGSLCSHAHFLTGLVTKEDALLGMLSIVLSRMHSCQKMYSAIVTFSSFYFYIESTFSSYSG